MPISNSILSRRRSLRFAMQTGKLRSERGCYRISQSTKKAETFVIQRVTPAHKQKLGGKAVKFYLCVRKKKKINAKEWLFIIVADRNVGIF